MALRNDKPSEKPEEDEDELEEQPPLRAPSSSGGRLPTLNLKDGIGKSVLISLAVTVIVLVGMAYMGGVSFVTKKDFAKNMADLVTVMDSTVTVAKKAQTDVAAAVQSIPGIVTSQVDTKVAQSVSQLNSQIATLNSKLATVDSTGQSNASKINELTIKSNDLTAKVNTDVGRLGSDIAALRAKLNADTANLTAKDTEITTKIAGLESTIASIEDRLDTLENQSIVASIVVTDTVTNLSISSGVAVATPLTVTNNGAIDVAVPVKLVVTAPSGVTSISTATMTGTYTSSKSGSVVTYLTTASVPANSTVTFGGIKITVTYVGTPSTTWTAQWSKQ